MEDYKPKYFSGKFQKKTPFSRFKSKVFDNLDAVRRLDFIGAVIVVSGITLAYPCKITTSGAHGLSTGARIHIKDVVGMTELNNKDYVITVIDADEFTLDGINSTNYTAYSSGGNIYKLETEDESEVQEITFYNNGTGIIYLAETEANADPDLAGIIIKPNGSYDENVSNLNKFWINKSVTGTVDLRIFMKRYGEGV